MTDISEKTIEPFVGPIPDHDDALDVKVIGTVNVRESTQRSFSTGTATMSTGTESVPVLGADRQRLAGMLLNTSAQTVYLLANRSDTAGNGFPLAAGAALSIEHQAPVYALCPGATAAAQVTLAYALERAV